MCRDEKAQKMGGKVLFPVSLGKNHPPPLFPGLPYLYEQLAITIQTECMACHMGVRTETGPLCQLGSMEQLCPECWEPSGERVRLCADA